MHSGDSPHGSLGWRVSCCSRADPVVHRTKVAAPNQLDGAEFVGTTPAKRGQGVLDLPATEYARRLKVRRPSPARKRGH